MPLSLSNDGNSCYLNSSLQLLLNNETLVEEFTKYKKHSTTIQKLFQLEIDDLKRILKFNTYEQQDAHEFLVLLFDNIHKQTKDIDTIITFSIFVSPHKTINDLIIKTLEKQKEKFGFSFLNNLFTGILLSITACKCGYKDTNIETFDILDLDSTTSIMHSISHYMEPEYIESSLCKCGHVGRHKHTIIYGFPKFLLLHFRKNGHSEQIILDHTLIFTNNHNGSIYKYNLKSFINHYGSSVNSGHFNAVVEESSKWYLVDDSAVVPIDKPVCNNNVYILLYERI